ncbi:carboxyl-terminal processing protease [Chitinophaga jiangningensis]|uniref:Carboxyl-terminal processing protease n=1 Tax=Chitinophaga jiangningensis TaxID=1419482 RepID=A0A1M7J3F8_9BACT|nr:carboxy terminal-processing peptidase [Chitinophaga jiangningensis]SHM47630.1 carboxyl-terminal processing protease [Chitinophaga jiangningensis]
MTIAKYCCYLPILLMSYTAIAGENTDPQKELNRKNTIRLVMNRIKNEHYAPKTVNDQFSQRIWQQYLKVIDANKNTLLQEDVDALRKYETLIDDQLTSQSLEYFNAAYTIQANRLAELQVLYRTLLARPVNFSKKETVAPTRTMASFPKNEKERAEIWRKSMKYEVLKKMLDIQRQDSTKSDVETEAAARKAVLANMDGLFKTLLSTTAADDRFAAFLNTVAMEMDPHTSFMAPIDASLRESMMTHRYFGLGMELTAQDGDVVIKRVLPGGTADLSGLLHADDRILELSDDNGKMINVAGMSITEASRLIRGPLNSIVKMRVRKASGEVKQVEVKRGEIKEDANAARSAVVVEGTKKIGYIQLSEFYLDAKNINGVRCARDVAMEVLKLKEQGVNGMVIDLRGNPGGSLDEVVAMTGLFVKSGPVVLGKGRDKIESYTINNNGETLYDGPLAVMVDESSASASEIFSAAIQDYKRGIVVGSPTSYGKGTMQVTYPMGKLGDSARGIANINYGSMALTIKKFYRINGTTTQLGGVVPDVIFPSKKIYAKIRERDFESAMPADTIPAARFQPYTNTALLQQTIRQANEKIARDSNYQQLRYHVEWLHSQENQPINLEKGLFRKQLQESHQHELAIDSALTLSPDHQLSMQGTADDKLPAEKRARYQDWLKACARDRQLAETVQMLTGMAKN